MRTSVLFLLTVLTSIVAQAQFIKNKSINAQIGLGLSSPYNSGKEIVDNGFFAQGELILKVASWVQLRPYAGVILTNSNGKDINDNPTNEKGESKAFLLGGKARVRAPIPWVAPYIEIGIGTSIGKFETVTVIDNINKSGVVYHIPFTLGLELGKHHSVDLGFTYYFQPSVKQYAGAFVVGMSFPI